LDKKIIRPNLQKKKVVVLDSYIDSAFVYRGLEKRIEIDLIRSFVEKTSDLLFPDITFLLDIDPQKAQKRLKERKLNADDCENRDDSNLEFHHKIRNHYLELKNLFPERIYIINAERSENEILEEVKTIIKKCFPDKESEKTLPNLVRVMIKNEKGELLLVKDKK
jgi:dTMP kinase